MQDEKFREAAHLDQAFEDEQDRVKDEWGEGTIQYFKYQWTIKTSRLKRETAKKRRHVMEDELPLRLEKRPIHAVLPPRQPQAQRVSRALFALFLEPGFQEPLNLPPGKIVEDCHEGDDKLPDSVLPLNKRWKQGYTFW